MPATQKRILLALAVLSVYFLVLGPLRGGVVTYAAAPLATLIAGSPVQPLPGHAATLEATRQPMRWQSPGGLLLLYGGLALALGGASLRLFGVLVLAHLVLGAVSFAAFVAAAGGHAGAVPVKTFAEDYLLVGATLAIAALAFVGSSPGLLSTPVEVSGASSTDRP